MYHILLIIQMFAVIGTFAGFTVLLRTKPSEVLAFACIIITIAVLKGGLFDVVVSFMDQMMPDMDGVEATNFIRKMGYTEDKLNIIALTANAISGTKEYLPASYIEYQTVATNGMSDNETGKPVEATSENDNFMNGIDWNEGISFCGGNKGIYVEVLKAVLQYGEEKMVLIEQCMKNKDYERYVIEVHALKSNAASIGAGKMSELAKAQEMAGKEGRFDEIDANGQKLLANYADMLKVIEAFLEKNE